LQNFYVYVIAAECMYVCSVLVRHALVLKFFAITGSCLLVLRYWIIVMVQACQLESCTKI